MTPSSRLRFVERVVPAPEYGEGIGKTVRILQQWYEWDIQYPTASGEWRDVPLEKEHD